MSGVIKIHVKTVILWFGLKYLQVLIQPTSKGGKWSLFQKVQIKGGIDVEFNDNPVNLTVDSTGAFTADVTVDLIGTV